MSFNSKWCSEDDGILIDFVRNHEAIYNVKSKEHRKTQLKQNWWREIGEILNKTDSDCSKRWCYIRDYYIRRRGKPGTGSSGEAAKKRSDLLSFLDSLPSSRRSSITNVVDEIPGDSSVIMENAHENSERTQTPGDRTVIMKNTHSEETQSNTQEIEDFICDNNDHKKNGKAKTDKKRENNAHAPERLNLLKQIVNRNSAQNGLDENDLFFGSMAKIVKNLPRYEQAQLRLQIGSLVGNAELRHISNNLPQSSTVSPRPSTSNSDYYQGPLKQED